MKRWLALLYFPLAALAQQPDRGDTPATDREGEAQSPQAYELQLDGAEPAGKGGEQHREAPVVREFKPSEEVLADTILSLPADI
ncbi:hypothetical protein [Litorivivens sp.]|uniref:hypothetical protein n=1 Tax=Litorivivens sp. TaxID=2020868 RepID=UPI00356784ED